MNLTKQFPDISEKLRAKIKISARNYKPVNAPQSSSYIEDQAVVKYYEGEFRRWHLKLLFIVVVTLSSFYLVLLKSGWIFHWVTGR